MTSIVDQHLIDTLLADEQIITFEIIGDRRSFRIDLLPNKFLLTYAGKKLLVEHALNVGQIERMAAWASGKGYAQDLDFLDPGTREFLISGITPEEWDRLFPNDEDTLH